MPDGVASSRADRWLVVAAFLIGVAVMLINRPFSHAEAADASIYDYIAQTILRGGTPYRDVVDVKGPGAPLLGALAMLAGRFVGLSDIYAVRVLHVVMAGLLSAVTCLVARTFLRSRMAALIACLVPLVRPVFADMLLGGIQPKLPMMVFGLLTLWLIARDRPFTAGVFSMLACLCWQPGLLFTGVALLMASRYLTTWRDGRGVRVLAGAALPLVPVVVYFSSRGALGDFWAWTIVYNATVDGPGQIRPFGRAVAQLWFVARRLFGPDFWLVLVGAAGALALGIQQVRTVGARGLARSPADLARDALVLPPLIYLAFSLINFQSGPDFIPFLPFIGIFFGWSIVAAAAALGRQGGRRLEALRLDVVLPAAAGAVLLGLLVLRNPAIRYSKDLAAQTSVARAVAQVLSPDDRIYAYGSAELLVILNRPNLNPYVLLDMGMDRFELSRRGVTFTAIIDEMEARTPKVLSLTRTREFTGRAALDRWVSAHYDLVPGREGLYVRRGAVAEGAVRRLAR